MTDTNTLEQVATTAKAIILPCGEARQLIHQALDAAGSGDAASARELLVEAKAKSTLGHRAQTTIVQSEARGEQQIYSVLFTHAQDILMTVMSELAIAGKIVDVFERLDERIDALEKRP
jgi:PTS system cellobiose-specific IIA component